MMTLMDCYMTLCSQNEKGHHLTLSNVFCCECVCVCVCILNIVSNVKILHCDNYYGILYVCHNYADICISTHAMRKYTSEMFQVLHTAFASSYSV